MSQITVKASSPSNRTGYCSFELGSFKVSRDEYFVYIEWPSKSGKMTHYMSADAFLRAMMRDVAWGFFYYQVNFDAVFGTNNLYGKVEMFAGSYNEAYKGAGLDLKETFETPLIMATFKQILDDWTNEGFDPFAAPEETGTAWLGKKNGDNRAAINREREVCKRMVQFAFQKVSLDEVVASVDEDNVASRKVLVKSGLLDRGRTRSYGKDGPIYRVTRDEWNELQQSIVLRSHTGLSQ